MRRGWIIKLLIIIYSYKPVCTPRSIRWAAIGEYWVSQGHSVDIVCSWEPGLPSEEVLKGVNVYRPVTLMPKVFPAIASRLKIHKNISPTKNGTFTSRAFVTVAKHVYANTWKKIYWPDYACLWYFPSLRKTRKLLASWDYDGVISVSHPFTGHLVGLKTKKQFPKTRWIADIGDPFCFLNHTPLNNARLYRSLNYRTDKKVFAYADAIAVTTTSTMREYSKLFPDKSSKIKVIPPLAFLPETEVQEPFVFSKSHKIKLIFIGTLYKTIRNPAFLLMLFSKLLQTELKDKIELHFFGDINDCSSVFDEYRILINDKIFTHGTVTHEKVFNIINQADILVNIGNDTLYQLPSKLAEYLLANKPILNIVKTKTDSSVSFLENKSIVLNVFADNDKPTNLQIKETANLILNPLDSDLTKSKPWLNQFSPESIAKSYQCLIERAY
ncbi:MAG: glycosyltransferase family 4 protein [Planctomycetes bacterium]|nr:glycosyltransferase family 4 protein [Planctomycetota bacterium]